MFIFNRRRVVKVPTEKNKDRKTKVIYETKVVPSVLSQKERFLLDLAKPTNDKLIIARNSIILNAHFIEKEMAVNNVDVASTKFLSNIANSLRVLIDANYYVDDFAISLACNLLQTYDPDDKLNIQTAIPAKYKEDCKTIKVGRIDSKHPLYDEKNINFIKSRHSHRRFKDVIVDKKTILSIIETSACCPTACNRQPCKIIYSLTREGNEKLKELVPDVFVRQNIPNFFAIVVDKTMFNQGEELQGLINGGIFLQNTLLAIHAHGLGATAFQTPIFLSLTRNDLSSFGVKENEIVIATIGFGYVEDKAKVAAAFKRRAKDISRTI